MAEMPPRPLQQRPDKQDFVIGGASPVNLAELVKHLQADPDVEAVGAQGPEDNPTLLTATMTPERAEQLRQQHSELIVEPNLRVEPSSPEPADTITCKGE